MSQYTWSGNPCVRINRLSQDEEHPCYYCGFPLKLDGIVINCSRCEFLICPNCKKCLCNGDYTTRIALMHLRDKYCCNLEYFKIGISLLEKYLKLIPHFKDALDYCRKKEGYTR